MISVYPVWFCFIWPCLYVKIFFYWNTIRNACQIHPRNFRIEKRITINWHIYLQRFPLGFRYHRIWKKFIRSHGKHKLSYNRFQTVTGEIQSDQKYSFLWVFMDHDQNNNNIVNIIQLLLCIFKIVTVNIASFCLIFSRNLNYFCRKCVFFFICTWLKYIIRMECFFFSCLLQPTRINTSRTFLGTKMSGGIYFY